MIALALVVMDVGRDQALNGTGVLEILDFEQDAKEPVGCWVCGIGHLSQDCPGTDAAHEEREGGLVPKDRNGGLQSDGGFCAILGFVFESTCCCFCCCSC